MLKKITLLSLLPLQSYAVFTDCQLIRHDYNVTSYSCNEKNILAVFPPENIATADRDKVIIYFDSSKNYRGDFICNTRHWDYINGKFICMPQIRQDEQN